MVYYLARLAQGGQEIPTWRGGCGAWKLLRPRSVGRSGLARAHLRPIFLPVADSGPMPDVEAAEISRVTVTQVKSTSVVSDKGVWQTWIDRLGSESLSQHMHPHCFSDQPCTSSASCVYSTLIHMPPRWFQAKRHAQGVAELSFFAPRLQPKLRLGLEEHDSDVQFAFEYGAHTRVNDHAKMQERSEETISARTHAADAETGKSS